jgi:hypothetical protein
MGLPMVSRFLQVPGSALAANQAVALPGQSVAALPQQVSKHGADVDSNKATRAACALALLDDNAVVDGVSTYFRSAPPKADAEQALKLKKELVSVKAVRRVLAAAGSARLTKRGHDTSAAINETTGAWEKF